MQIFSTRSFDFAGCAIKMGIGEYNIDIKNPIINKALAVLRAQGTFTFNESLDCDEGANDAKQPTRTAKKAVKRTRKKRRSNKSKGSVPETGKTEGEH